MCKCAICRELLPVNGVGAREYKCSVCNLMRKLDINDIIGITLKKGNLKVEWIKYVK